MKKPLPRPDLQELRDRLSVMWSYLRHVLERETQSPTIQQPKDDFIRSMDDVVHRVVAGGSLRELRVLLGDFNEWAEGLRREQVTELESLLADRFGSAANLDDADRRQRIVQRGRIRTADEYRLIAARVETIYADPAHRDELATLNGLLASFEPPSSLA